MNKDKHIEEAGKEEMVDLPETLKKRAIRYNGHHYIRVKWVQSYIDFVRSSLLQEIEGKIPLDEPKRDSYAEGDDMYAKGWNAYRENVLEILKSLY